MMKGHFNSIGYVGIMPDGTERWFCTDEDYFEAYEEALKERHD